MCVHFLLVPGLLVCIAFPPWKFDPSHLPLYGYAHICICYVYSLRAMPRAFTGRHFDLTRVVLTVVSSFYGFYNYHWQPIVFFRVL